MSVIFFGTPQFAVPPLQSLIDSGEPVRLVVTQPDKKTGRGRNVLPPPVKILAEKHSIDVIQPVHLQDDAFRAKLRSLSPDFIVVVAYGKLLKNDILQLPRYGCINVHASLLPKYRGAAPIQWAIINGESTTGVTTMLMDTGMDTGDILLQRPVAISRKDTSLSLAEKLSREGAALLTETLQKMRIGSMTPIPQSGVPTYAPILTKDNGRIDWNKDAESLFHFVRGMYPWPGAHTRFRGKYLKILQTETEQGTGRPGRVERITRNRVIIGTGNHLLSVKVLQPEGKKEMDAQAFANGYRLNEGDYFE